MLYKCFIYISYLPLCSERFVFFKEKKTASEYNDETFK